MEQPDAGGNDRFISLERKPNWYIMLEENTFLSNQIEIQIPQTSVPEETTFTATAWFRDRDTQSASTPTTIQYRVDCLTTRREIVDWTSVSSPAGSNDIVMSATYNQILDDANNIEKKQLTVRVDTGLTTQVVRKKTWKVENLQGIQ